MKTIDEERKEFEAEYIAILQPSDELVQSEVLSRFSDGDYKKFATHNSWRLWQAARQSNNVPVAPDKYFVTFKYENPDRGMTTDHHYFNSKAELDDFILKPYLSGGSYLSGFGAKALNIKVTEYYTSPKQSTALEMAAQIAAKYHSGGVGSDFDLGMHHAAESIEGEILSLIPQPESDGK